MWLAITAVSLVAIGACVALVGGLVIKGIAFLQPLLMPVAVAGILAYLLEPVVRWIERRGLSRLNSVLAVFIAFALLLLGLGVYVIPPAWKQSSVFVAELPEYAARAQELTNRTIAEARSIGDLPFFDRFKGPEDEKDSVLLFLENSIDEGVDWLQQQLPGLALAAGRFVQRSLGGFLGVFGTLIGFLLVPVFLFFFLKEGPAIASNWSNYLPLRASPLKSEIVSLLSEINSYLINFFRGQLLVSMIDGAITAVLLLIIGLDFALLIGLLVAVLGLIPYLGVTISWIPAVIIAAAQFGDWWHPLLVTIIFLAVNNLDGIIIAPKIVGESVGLHPLTVILSVLAWSMILGGLLGALLAVPLTATLKVVLKRYFWDKPASAPVAAVPSG